MFSWPRNIVNNIDKLLENPDTTLNQILQDSTFTNSIRTPSKKLASFLLSENNLNQLINYALTNDFELPNDGFENTKNDISDEENKRRRFNKYQRSSILALTNQSKLFQDELIKNELLKKNLIQFPSSKYSSDPKVCGHYSRIVEILLRTSNGKYLYQVPCVVDFLIKNIHVLPIRELFVVLFCEFTTIFIKCSSGINPVQSNDDTIESSRAEVDSLDESDDNSEESEDLFDQQTTKEERDAFFKKLLDDDQVKSGNSTFFVFSAINGIFTQNIEYVRYFATAEFFKQTLEIATSAVQKQLSSIEAFKTAFRIMEWSSQNDPISILKSEEIANIINDAESKFNLVNRPSIDGITAYAAQIFIASAAQLITFLFEDQSNTFLNASIFQAFKKLDWSDQLKLVKEKDLVHRIIQSFASVDPKDDTNTSLFVNNDNAHITELAAFLNTEYDIRKNAGNLNEDSKCFESDEWQNFVNNVLNVHINQRDTFDSVQSSSDSSVIDVDDVDIDDEEEEEEDDSEEQFNEPFDMSSSSDDDDRVEKTKKAADSELHSACDDEENGGKEVDHTKSATKTDTEKLPDDKETKTDNN